MTSVVLLAAGRGVRMRSTRPKVLHEAAGRALLDRALDTALAVAGGPAAVVVVVSEGRRRRRTVALPEGEPPPASDVASRIRRAARATRCARPPPPARSARRRPVVVLSGDVPLLEAAAVKGLVEALKADKKAAVAVLTATLPNPTGYGRIVRDGRRSFVRIREEKDSSSKEKRIAEINTGTYAFDRAFLERSLPSLDLQESSRTEFYLTDVLSLARTGRTRRGRSSPAIPPPPSASTPARTSPPWTASSASAPSSPRCAGARRSCAPRRSRSTRPSSSSRTRRSSRS